MWGSVSLLGHLTHTQVGQCSVMTPGLVCIYLHQCLQQRVVKICFIGGSEWEGVYQRREKDITVSFKIPHNNIIRSNQKVRDPAWCILRT
mmetsp:Transcript_57/g.125  ORF Transcript_57/g.125 Transcript_57/m.125 type:complete len:90 (+) Transcript_57:1040-1309(+)